MFWAQRPAQCKHREVGAAVVARGVHAPSLLEAPQAQGAVVQSCLRGACRGSLHLPSVVMEVVGLVADDYHQQDQGTGGRSAE